MNILITGASSGIGGELALSYAKTGNHLGLIGRNASRLNEISTRCKSLGASVTEGKLDITDKPVLKIWIEEFERNHPIDIAIANAGIFSTSDSRANESLNSIDEILSINFISTVHTIHLVLEGMRKRQRGHIVIISSLSAYRGMPFSPAYSASKAALNSYFEAKRGLLKKDGISTTIICPGFIDTPMIAAYPVPRILKTHPEKAARRIKKAIDRKHLVLDFPLHHRLGMKVLDLMPARFADWLMLKFFGL